MKNIRFYDAPKYKGADYEKIEENIYKTIITEEDDGMSLSLEQITDKELLEALEGIDKWNEETDDFDEIMYNTVYNGQRYYKEITENDGIVYYKKMGGEESEICYVTSFIFEQEPELGENEPSDKYISQYPLEDILDEFYVYCYDYYEAENEADKVNSYQEFASGNIEDIRKLTSIVGKHVYNKEDGEYIRLIIE